MGSPNHHVHVAGQPLCSQESANIRRSPTPTRHLLLASLLITIPLLLIAALMLYFVLGHLVPRPTGDHISTDHSFQSGYYYTTKTAPTILTVSAWAPIICQWILASFMFIASYQIAHMARLESSNDTHAIAHAPTYFRHVMRGDPLSLKSWFAGIYVTLRTKRNARIPVARSIHFAALSLLLATCLTYVNNAPASRDEN